MGYISRAKAAKIPNPPEFLLEKLNYHHSQVVVKEETLGRSYCLFVPDTHQFFQNGFAGWNSQGSQWKNVGIVVEGMFWRNWRDSQNKGDARRWLYTAITRASETLTIWV
jgi:hypothetical protein